MLNFKRSLLLSLLSSILIVSQTACSTVSGSFEQKAKVSIPDLPSSVVYSEPRLPKSAAKNAEDTAKVLEAYEDANSANKMAINAARRHNKGLQRIYNPSKKKEVAPATSSWVAPKWPENWLNLKPF